MGVVGLLLFLQVELSSLLPHLLPNLPSLTSWCPRCCYLLLPGVLSQSSYSAGCTTSAQLHCCCRHQRGSCHSPRNRPGPQPQPVSLSCCWCRRNGFCLSPRIRLGPRHLPVVRLSHLCRRCVCWRNCCLILLLLTTDRIGCICCCHVAVATAAKKLYVVGVDYVVCVDCFVSCVVFIESGGCVPDCVGCVGCVLEGLVLLVVVMELLLFTESDIKFVSTLPLPTVLARVYNTL